MKNGFPEITISDRKIGEDYPPYIIAEMSANHNGKIENAFKLIEIAKQCGAQAVKLQTYTADTLTINSTSKDFMITGGLWDGKSLYQLYNEASTPWDWHEDLFHYAENLGITIFSSPFDPSAIDFLEDLEWISYFTQAAIGCVGMSLVLWFLPMVHPGVLIFLGSISYLSIMILIGALNRQDWHHMIHLFNSNKSSS